jgi:hypothetical protein
MKSHLDMSIVNLNSTKRFLRKKKKKRLRKRSGGDKTILESYFDDEISQSRL